MLIDWMTARLDYDNLNSEVWAGLRLLNDRVQRFCPKTGDVKWESCAWDSVRSDSHSLAIKVGGDALWLQGSPARVCGSGDAVFGEGAAAALDLPGCLSAMIGFAANHLGILLPHYPEVWKVSRIDITQNIKLGSLADVRVALRHLRECEGGRYRVSQQAGDTVYWSHRSHLQSGKAYAKGPHIQYMINRNNYTGRTYTPTEIEASNKLLRLELKLGSQYFRERIPKPWHQLTPFDITNQWNAYFHRMIGAAEMIDTHDTKTRIIQSAKTEGQGRAAYGCWLMIQDQGWEAAREAFSKTSWYRHIQILHKAGLGDMDISAGRVVPFRQKIIEAQQVNTWHELIKKAA